MNSQETTLFMRVMGMRTVQERLQRARLAGRAMELQVFEELAKVLQCAQAQRQRRAYRHSGEVLRKTWAELQCMYVERGVRWEHHKHMAKAVMVAANVADRLCRTALPKMEAAGPEADAAEHPEQEVPANEKSSAREGAKDSARRGQEKRPCIGSIPAKKRRCTGIVPEPAVAELEEDSDLESEGDTQSEAHRRWPQQPQQRPDTPEEAGIAGTDTETCTEAEGPRQDAAVMANALQLLLRRTQYLEDVIHDLRQEQRQTSKHLQHVHAHLLRTTSVTAAFAAAAAPVGMLATLPTSPPTAGATAATAAKAAAVAARTAAPGQGVATV